MSQHIYGLLVLTELNLCIPTHRYWTVCGCDSIPNGPRRDKSTRHFEIGMAWNSNSNWGGSAGITFVEQREARHEIWVRLRKPVRFSTRKGFSVIFGSFCGRTLMWIRNKMTKAMGTMKYHILQQNKSEPWPKNPGRQIIMPIIDLRNLRRFYSGFWWSWCMTTGTSFLFH